MENLDFWLTCLIIFIALVIVLVILIKANSKISQNRIEEIFEELKKDNLIEKDRKLKTRDNLVGGFATGLFPIRIYYNPKFCEISESSIKFSLLHEEGHVKKGYHGILLSNIIFIIGGILFLIDILWVLIHFFLIQTLYFNWENWLQLLTWGLFLAFFCVRLASNPLQTDEYVSDIFASEKLRDTFHIEKPSEILESTLDELSKFQEKLDQSKNMKETFFSDIKNAL